MRLVTPRPTRGTPSLAQGAYGTAGNLELIVADAVDGLWVFWFNSDAPGTDPVSGVAPGAWSGGMLFAEGTAYERAIIHQTRRGPDFLEVVAITADGRAESWYWSPGPGFQRRGSIAAAGEPRLTEYEGGFILQVDDRVFTADAAAYPQLEWFEATPAAVDPGTLRVALSSRGGGMLELTYLTGGAPHHDSVLLG